MNEKQIRFLRAKLRDVPPGEMVQLTPEEAEFLLTETADLPVPGPEIQAQAPKLSSAGFEDGERYTGPYWSWEQKLPDGSIRRWETTEPRSDGPRVPPFASPS